MTANVDANGLIDESNEFNNIQTLVLTVSNEDNDNGPLTISQNTDSGSSDSIPILLLSITIVGLAAAAFYLDLRKLNDHILPQKNVQNKDRDAININMRMADNAKISIKLDIHFIERKVASKSLDG